MGKSGYKEKKNYIKIQEFYFQHQSIGSFSALHVTEGTEDLHDLQGKGALSSKWNVEELGWIFQIYAKESRLQVPETQSNLITKAQGGAAPPSFPTEQRGYLQKRTVSVVQHVGLLSL